MQNADPPDTSEEVAARALPVLGVATAKYLDDRATESFKRQTDLEESIWRSLPLFTGGLLAAGAVVTKAAALLPPFGWTFYPLAAFAMLALATMAFGIAFWWLWQVVKPRDFDYPADDEAISRYASDMMDFHAGQGLEGQALDDEVMRELRLYMASTFAMAAKSTLSNNQIRLSARSQVLIFLLSGFLLAFACFAIMFGFRFLSDVEAGAGVRHDVQAPYVRKPSCAAAGTPCAPSHARDPRRGMADQIDHRTTDTDKIGDGRRQAGKP